MRLPLLRAVQQAPIGPGLQIPVALFVTCAATLVFDPPRLSLLTSAISWGLLAAIGVVKAGLGFNSLRGQVGARQKLCWAAGGLLALTHICERAIGDREVLRWTKSFLPITIYIVLRTQSDEYPSSLDSAEPSSTSKETTISTSKRFLTIATLASLVALAYGYLSLSKLALGMSSACFTALALILLEDAFVKARTDKVNGRGGFVSANGSLLRRESNEMTEDDGFFVCLRDVSTTVAACCFFATLVLMSFRADGLDPRSGLHITYQRKKKIGLLWSFFEQWFYTILVGFVNNFLLIAAAPNIGSFQTAFVELASSLFVGLIAHVSITNIWFASIAWIAGLYCVETSWSSYRAGFRTSLRWKQTLLLVAGLSLVIQTLAHLWMSGRAGMSVDTGARLNMGPPLESHEPMALVSRSVHPIDQLVGDADQKFKDFTSRQSNTLSEAVVEYRRRYQLAPPPNFDKWFEFAKKKNAQVIDEYDTIHRTLMPFWAHSPVAIRSRVREAIGYDENHLIALTVRDGKAVKIERGELWQQDATLGMIRDFVHALPDMDIAFNVHDEPRIVIPHDALSQMIAIAREKAIPAAAAASSPQNGFSKRPADMNDGKRIEEFRTTRFNVYAHQPTWAASRLSCPESSPARDFRGTASDNMTSYALGELGFIYNISAFSDICMSPSLRESFGFFERPNAFNVAHELIPIFSQSKLSSFQDILYPSPWYWAGKVYYDKKEDIDWDGKADTLWWRGSTTGGFSRDGGWRHQHRQSCVRNINGQAEAEILAQDSAKKWEVKEVNRPDYKDLIDVKFTYIGQCDPGDCDAQKEFFTVVDRADTKEGWKFKHLLDMDGNAFSGRFYAFLRSKSLPYKMALFREWHQEWLKPWVHYIPLSLHGNEWLETVRYMAKEATGQSQAAKIATHGREWAEKVLRKDDFEVWFFRLLLEYGRIIDDNRDTIGFAV